MELELKENQYHGDKCMTCSKRIFDENGEPTEGALFLRQELAYPSSAALGEWCSLECLGKWIEDMQ